MSLPHLSLGAWHSILLVLALELGCAAAGLLFLSFWAKRSWGERLLVAVPIAAFIWLLLMARGVQAQLDYWTHYLAFQAAHYTPDAYPSLWRQTQQDYGHVVDGANRLGWAALLVTEGIVLLGGALALRWWKARRQTLQRPLVSARASGETGEPDITVEPLRQHQRR